MASFPYKSQLLLYDNDDGTQSLRHQKLRIEDGTTDTIAPNTPLITDREVSTNYQYEGTNKDLRHVNVALEDLEVKTVIPYSAGNTSTLKSCIREVLNSSGVIAGRYIGESQAYGDTANTNF